VGGNETDSLRGSPNSTPAPSAQITPVLNYRHASLPSPSIEFRWEGSDLLITIPPPYLWRLMVARTIRVTVLGIAFATCLIAYLAMLEESETSLRLLTAIVVSVVSVAVGRALRKAWRRFMLAVHDGRTPAVIRVSPQSLGVAAPILGRNTQHYWQQERIADVGIRNAGLLPILVPYIRLQVSKIDDTADIVLLPCRGSEPLGTIEENVRDVLGLRTRLYNPA
jgi:hypothetical protein